MIIKFFHIIAIIAYLNLLTFDSFSSSTGKIVQSGESIIEFVLDDLVNMEPINQHAEDTLLLQDDYRILNLNYQVPSIFVFFFAIVFTASAFLKDRKHPFYYAKTRCLPGNYSFLYRYRLF